VIQVSPAFFFFFFFGIFDEMFLLVTDFFGMGRGHLTSMQAAKSIISSPPTTVAVGNTQELPYFDQLGL
jgi:hypothetical protein